MNIWPFIKHHSPRGLAQEECFWGNDMILACADGVHMSSAKKEVCNCDNIGHTGD